MFLTIFLLSFALVKVLYIVSFVIMVAIIHYYCLTNKQSGNNEQKQKADIYISFLTKKEHSGYAGSMNCGCGKIASKN